MRLAGLTLPPVPNYTACGPEHRGEAGRKETTVAKEPSYTESERAAKAAAKSGKTLDAKYAKVLATNPARAARLAKNIRNQSLQDEQARMKERNQKPDRGLSGLLGPKNRGLRG